MDKSLRIAVIGAGIGGCAVALLLARRGHAVEVFEQSPKVGPVGAGILLQPSGQRVLQTMGLLDSVTKHAERIDELVAWTHRGKLLSRLRYADAPCGGTAFGVHRGDLFSAIHTKMLEAGVTLHLNHPVTDFADAAIVDFDLIVAADGARSRLRENATIPHYCHHYEPAALWAVGRCDTIHNQLLQSTRDTRQLAGLLPMGGGRCSFFWGINRSDWPILQQSTFAHWRLTVLTLMPQAEPMFETVNTFGDLMFASYRGVYMPCVYKDRTVFLGDAAHAASPHLGQGVNLALLDACDLANAIDNQATVRAAHIAYNRAQRWRNAYYSLVTAGLTPTFQGRMSVLGHARDWALPMLQRISPIRQLMLMTLTGVIRKQRKN